MELIQFLGQTRLFEGIGAAAAVNLLECIRARRVNYSGGQRIIREGETVTGFGILLSGAGRAVKEGFDGRPVIISLLKAGSEIGVILAASPGRKSPVTVQADGEAEVLFIPFSSLISRCSKNCGSHERLLQNYLAVVAEKGLVLHDRIDCLLKATVREKILSYLFRISGERGRTAFDLPVDRAAMAEYLNVDRSALSRELSRMKQEGLIDFHKNHFALLQPPCLANRWVNERKTGPCQ